MKSEPNVTVCPVSEDEKRIRARVILQEARNEILSILWETDPQEYCNEKLMLVWLEEDYEYALRRLQLNQRSEGVYIGKLHRIFGQYSEVIPYAKKKKKYSS